MSPPEPPSNNFRYFVFAVLGAAVLLGVYFVQLNAQRVSNFMAMGQ